MTSQTSSKPFRMEYRLVGNTGLKISVLGVGCMTFDSVERSLDLMSIARKHGVNFFDNAEAYGNPRGSCESNFGKALRILQERDPVLWRRSELVITTKLFWGPQRGDIQLGPDRRAFGPNEMGLTRKHLMEGTDDSLARLQLKYVDLLYAHRPDPLTSIEEVVRSFTDIIRSGKAFYWGTSMWKKSQIIEAHWIARCYGLVAPVIEQPIYSMFDRDVVEYEYLDLFEQPYALSTSIWNVLDRGVLAGKYIDRNNIPSDGRLAGNNRLGSFVGHLKHVTQEKNEKVVRLMNIADELNTSMATLAIGWLIKNKNVTTCILGGTKVHQMEENMKSIAVANKLDAAIVQRIEAILNNKPKMRSLDNVHRKSAHIISRL